MRYLKYFALLAFLALPAAYSHAQVSIGVQIGPTYGIYNAPPVCEYGFYPTYPFGCAPYGYYGPEWFASGIFIGAGPWYNFYYTHSGFYRPFYVSRGFGFHRGFERFHDGDRFRGTGFRSFRDDRGFRDRDFRGRDFRGDDHGHFRGNEGFRSNGYRSFNNGGDRAYRNDGGRSYSGGGESHGNGRSYGGGESHGGGRSYGNGGSHNNGGGHSYGGGESHGSGRSYGNGGSHNSGGGHSYGGGSHGGGESHGGGKSYGHR
jgi:hypothetical protein